MSKQITGRVDEIIVNPGREEILIRLMKDNESDDQNWHHPYLIVGGGTIRFNNIEANLAGIVLHAAMLHQQPGAELHVTLHPRDDRYSASTDAEFVTKYPEEAKT